MSSVAVIGDIDTVTGFRLGGVKRTEVVKSAEETTIAFDKLLDEEVSIIIITQVLANEIREHINRKIGSNVLPMIIEIPDKDGSSEGSSDQMADLIKRVIGVEMVKWLLKEKLLKLLGLLLSQMVWEEPRCTKWLK